MKKKSQEERLKEYKETMRREIDFQFSRFRYKDSVFYDEGCGTKTWFSVESTDARIDLTHLSQVMVKNFDTFITAGIPLSYKEKFEIPEIIPIIRQSLYVPLTLDVMMHMITIQDRFHKQQWPNIYPGILFLGSKLTVIKATGWKDKDPSIKLAVGDTCYASMQFRTYTKDDRGLWLPEVTRADFKGRYFSTAVMIETPS